MRLPAWTSHRPLRAFLQHKTQTKGHKLALELNRINDERKGVVAATVKEVNKRLQETPSEGPVIVLGNPNWRPGILGLVANTLVEAHGKPVFLWGREGGEVIRGSVRSPDVNVVDLMTSAKDIFNEFGGHTQSGGFSIAQERVHELAPRLIIAYEEVRAQAKVKEEMLLDRELDIEEVPFAMRALVRLAPFGEGNRKPIFLLRNLTITRIKTFGKGGDHLEVELVKGVTRVSGVSFFSTPESFSKLLEVGGQGDVVGCVENDWRGSPRLRVIDVI
jgi:single-stranded-DNA-specific exonuclease